MRDQTNIGTLKNQGPTREPLRLLFMPESASLAHLGRLLPLAQSLPEELYEITFACDPKLRFWIPATYGWETASSLPSDEFRRRLSRGEPLLDETLLTRQVKEDLALLNKIKPAAVIGDFRPSLAISAPLLGVPHINVTDAHWSPWAQIPFEAPGPLDTWWSRPLGDRLGKGIVDTLLPIGFRLQARPFNQVRRNFGLAPLSGDIQSIYTAGDAVAYTSLMEMVPTPGAPPSHQHVGPVLWEPQISRPTWWSNVPNDRPRVFVSVGSTGQWKTLEKVVDALRQLPVITLVATSGRGTVNPIPNQVYVADYLPGMETCKNSDLVICNGGSGTVYQALGAGVPVIGIAANVDQMAVMAPVVQRGAGRRIPVGRVEAVNWETEVTTLLYSREAQRSARQIANVMAQTDSAGTFLSLLEQTLGVEDNPAWADLREPARLS